MKKNRSPVAVCAWSLWKPAKCWRCSVVDAAGGGDFTTIQAAVTAAAAGDKIKVRAGHVRGERRRQQGADDRGTPSATYRDCRSGEQHHDRRSGHRLRSAGRMASRSKALRFGESGTNVDTEGTIGIRTSASFSGYEIKNNIIEAHTIGIYLNTDTSTTDDDRRNGSRRQHDSQQQPRRHEHGQRHFLRPGPAERRDQAQYVHRHKHDGQHQDRRRRTAKRIPCNRISRSSRTISTT